MTWHEKCTVWRKLILETVWKPIPVINEAKG